jgi:hypothetical protein
VQRIHAPVDDVLDPLLELVTVRTKGLRLRLKLLLTGTRYSGLARAPLLLALARAAVHLLLLLDAGGDVAERGAQLEPDHARGVPERADLGGRHRGDPGGERDHELRAVEHARVRGAADEAGEELVERLAELLEDGQLGRERVHRRVFLRAAVGQRAHLRKKRRTYLLQRLGKVVEGVYDAVIVDGSVRVHDVIAPARAQDTVDDVGDCGGGARSEGVAQIIDGTLKRRRRVQERVCITASVPRTQHRLTGLTKERVVPTDRQLLRKLGTTRGALRRDALLPAPARRGRLRRSAVRLCAPLGCGRAGVGRLRLLLPRPRRALWLRGLGDKFLAVLLRVVLVARRVRVRGACVRARRV